MEGLDFKSTNDRPIIGVLKALGLIDESGVPKQPYFDYLNEENHRTVLAEAIRRAYADLFKLNNKADEKDAGWVKNKFKMLTQGTKTDVVLGRMAATFVALCKEGDFSSAAVSKKVEPNADLEDAALPAPDAGAEPNSRSERNRFALAYNINVELPAIRDQAVYDAIFRSLRDNLL